MIARASSTFTDLETKPVYQYGALAAITLLAVLLRFYKLGEWSFWIDEVYTLGRIQAHYHDINSMVQNIPPIGRWLPLSLILSGGVFNVLGINEWSARLIPALIGSISIPLFYFPTKNILGARIALISVLLLTIAPWHVFWSQNARFFSSLMLFYSLALFAFYFGLERDRPGYLFIFIVLLYFALSERLFALFIIPVISCYLLSLKVFSFEMPSGLRWRNLLILILPGIVFVVYEIYNFINTGSSIGSYALSVFWGYPIDSPIRILMLTVFDIGIPLVVIGFFGGIYLILKKNRAGLFFLVGALVPVLLLVALNPFVFTVDRYVFVTLPSWIILGAITIKELINNIQDYGKVLAFGVLIILMADAFGANLMYYQLNNGNRLDWRGALLFIQDRKEDDDMIVATRKELGEYYLGEEVVDWREFDPELAGKQNKQIWFIIDSEGVWHGPKSNAKQEWLEENSRLLQFWYLRVREQINLRIYLFNPMEVVTKR